MINVVDIINTNSGHIYIDVDKEIIYLRILNEQYNKDEFTELFETIQLFLRQALQSNKKYHLLFDTKRIGIYPLSCYSIIKDKLEEIENVIKQVIHSTCVLVDKNLTSQILKFFFQNICTSQTIKNYRRRKRC